MECFKILLVAAVLLMLVFPNAQGWGEDGHIIVCKIAQPRLSKSAGEAVKKLLPEYAENELASLCLWPDDIKREVGYGWSAGLHFADTPDSLCNYDYDRDCKDLKTGEKGQCVVGAINNYTNQLLNYGSDTKCKSLLLHCGFVSDLGGNRVQVNWYTTKRNLHRVWDDDIIETAEERFYDSNRDDFVNAILQNITTEWADQVKGWESCSPSKVPCPNIYASESIEAACKWAYQDVTQNSVLEDDYFLSRLPIVTLRLAQAGVRLAASLNRIFGRQYAAVI
ncbi:S1/P1 nuclease [Sesbania bispinosa]|nr:S1/P1 nuclease [Sesbania bispinosa]